MATYVNDLRLKEIATGDESGTWGTSTNTNLELIAEAFSYGTEAITTNADTHTTTIADGSTDPGRSIYLKYTGTLDSACTITIGPNTVSKLWFIENATSGSQNIIISQGSGANITIPAGDTKVVYSDGAGSGAAFFDAFANLKVTDPAQTNITSVGTLTGLTVNTGTTNGAEVSIISTNTANSGANNPTLKLYRSGVLSGGFGQGGLLEFAGQNASGTEKTYATISGDIFDTTASSEDGYLTFKTMQAGTLTAAMEIDHQGFVGIGTTSPTFKLQVNGTGNLVKFAGANAQLAIDNSTTNEINIDAAGASDNLVFSTVSSERMRIDSSGQVGIGAASPSALLHVNSGTVNLASIFESTDVTTQVSFKDTNQESQILVTDGETRISADVNNEDANSAFTVRIDNSEKMRIDSSGNVGIGESSPDDKLHIKTASGDAALRLENSAGNNSRLILDSSNNTIIEFNSTPRIVLDSNGNVGIGKTPNRSRKLEVAGTMNLDDGSEYEWGDGSISIGGNSSTDVMTFATAGSERMRIQSSGRILIGRSTDYSSLGFKFQVDFSNSGNSNTRCMLVASDATASKTALTMRDKNVGTAAGTITYDGTSAQYNTSSDYRLKENIQPLENGLARVQQLNPVQFDWIETGGTSEGFIAHEAQEVFAEAVSGEKDGTEMQGMDYGRITPLLVKALQEQQTIIESLEARITALES